MKTIQFPKPSNLKCNMMPFIQGGSETLPDKYKPYSKVIDENFIELGEVGFLTIDESFVEKSKSQRGYNSKGVERNVHVEVGRKYDVNCWGSNRWGKFSNVTLDDSTRILIANSISDTCRFWDVKDMSETLDGDLSDHLDNYPIETGVLMKRGQIENISIFTPHECIPQDISENRQFFRIVGKGVKGREDYFTVNPLMGNIAV